ncbi:transcriptional regulator [Gordonia desulfuricans]|uniref:Transcriptional regulator n=1 Tax=Gordonia desulfuricans TaxID=89051 RepID=A0A7K3LPR8_9ACTN|nr:BTAD domain-containing putative transcriptional regulator [Gordonia desulfuricans]NDK90250.1 transcriptional regulator [Gordonia desulfuricans]
MVDGGVLIVGLWGPVAVIRASATGALDADADLTVVPGLRARRLLASLALADGRTRSATALIDDVWGDDPPRSPTAALHTQISRLRHLIGAAHLEATGTGYRLVGCRTDIDLVTDLVHAAEAADEAVAAARSWRRGVPGDDLGADGPGGPVAEVRQRAARAQDRLDRREFDAAMGAGNADAARVVAENRCRRDPLDESAHLDLMHALAAGGRVAEAVAVYAGLRRRLVTELGVDPGPRIAALHAELLAAEDDPGEPATAEDGRVPAPGSGRGVGLLADTTELVGRAADVDALAGLLGSGRLVTVQGPGGVGKTRVATSVGHRLVDAGATVFYAPLAPIRDADDLVPAIAAVLGVGESELAASGRPRRTVGDLRVRLIDSVRGRDLVLILDNCEQVIDACARLVAELLVADARIRVLTTSRAPLLLAGEQIYQLPTLDVDAGGSAVELFVTRARAVRPDADLQPAAVAALCVHLDGLPLAIELAAARIRTMTVDEIADRLVERFALLRGTDRTAPDRHRTLYAVIEWSWDLLDADGRRALRRLCRLPGGFTAGAAGIILGFSGFRLDDALTALANQSLLAVTESGGRVRYRMLEMVREFGESTLATDADESLSVHTAMRRWAREVARQAVEQYETRVDAHLVRHVADDSENLVWVLRECLRLIESGDEGDSAVVADALDTLIRVFPVLASFWMARGLHAEVVSWGARVLLALPAPPEDLQDERLRRDWMATVETAGAHQVVRGDLRLIARCRYHLRRLHRPEKTYDDAVELAAACVLSRTPTAAIAHLVRGTRARDARVSLTSHVARMNLAENLGDLDGALRDGRRVIERAVELGDFWMSGMARVALAGLHGQQCRWQRAIAYYRAGLVDLERLEAEDDVLQSRTCLVAALASAGDIDAAEREFEILADGWTPDDPDPQGGPETAGVIMLVAAELACERGEVDTAGALYRRATSTLRRDHPLGVQDPAVSMMLGVIAVGLWRCGLTADARALLPLLVEAVDLTLSGTAWRDLPQAGTVARALGTILCTDDALRADGARILMLSRRMRGRRDFPGCAAVDEQVIAVSGLSEDRWHTETRGLESLSRHQATERLRSILASRADDVERLGRSGVAHVGAHGQRREDRHDDGGAE